MALYLDGEKVLPRCDSASDTTFNDTNVAYEADDVQEALEKVTKSLTYAEYEALTDAEKNNGTIYLITDINGTGDKFQPVVYSAEEREIGVWTNGKPLYEKTIYNAGGTNGVWTFNHNISNLEMVTEANGGCIVHGYYDYSQISWQTIPRTSPDSANIGIVGISDSFISMYVNDAFSNRVTDIYITLRYTKSTDVAGSGTWTPQGVPAVHYSTDEQVVGTWIDGKTLYEKTIENTSFSAGIFSITFSDTTINNLFVFGGYWDIGNGNKRELNAYVGNGYYGYVNADFANNLWSVGGGMVGYTPNKVIITVRYTKSST